jgi:hypothetical protein
VQAGRVENVLGFLKDTWDGFVEEQVGVFLMLAFLAHQTLVTLDAIVRTIVRLTVTHRRLLEWETAAQAEMVERKSAVDVYLDWMPWVSLVISVPLALLRPRALPVAAPILILWGCSKYLSQWLNRPMRPESTALTSEDEDFLRTAALSTWRFFRELSNAENNWLVADNLQEEPPAIAHGISPTNLGMLLNSRLAAYDLGFTTLPEFVQVTERTLASARRLTRYRGHFLNWYHSQTLTPIEPLFVSTVDSGNLVCSLWTLKQGCLRMRTEPFVHASVGRGIQDYSRLLSELVEREDLESEIKSAVRDLRVNAKRSGGRLESSIQALDPFEQVSARLADVLRGQAEPRLDEVRYWSAEIGLRIRALHELANTLAPWLLPQYKPIRKHQDVSSVIQSLDAATLESLPKTLADLDLKLEALSQNADGEIESTAAELRSRLAPCAAQAHTLSQHLQRLAAEADSLASEMDFNFLYDVERKVLSIGYDVRAERLEESRYEVLASEARSAAFVAIAKEDIPQESWFHLGRAHTACEQERVLLSWSGTMFEYLMPALWMRSYPNTILEQTLRAVVRCQEKVVDQLGVPWGVSEAACSRQNDTGHYEYHAFGLRTLALRPSLPEGFVVSPYSTFLALAVDASAAMRNLHRMKRMGWFGRFGFYEATEFLSSGTDQALQPEVVRCWMAHHQGMILVSISNLLADSAIQERFHAEPMVAATERLLHERVPGIISIDRAEQPESEVVIAMPRVPAYGDTSLAPRAQ